MNNRMKILNDSNNEGKLTLHPEEAKSLGIYGDQKLFIRFGLQSLPIEVNTSMDLPQDEAKLSSEVIKKLNIPLSCHFDFQKENLEIQIGPCIGILTGSTEKSLIRRLNDLLDYVYHYDEIRGAIIVFSLENVDIHKLSVKGYRYNPLSNQWEKGIFGYPSSLFISTGSADTKWISHFKSVMGNTVFNDFYFNKWSIHRRLASTPSLTKYLPVSILYESPDNLYSFLQQYPKCIVKSINASKGSAIYHLSLKDQHLTLSYPKKDESVKVNFKNKDDVYLLFNQYFKKDEYMIQEALNLITHQNRTIDFRVILLKNAVGEWQVMGMFARHGQPGSILSNLHPLVTAGESALKDALQLNNSNITGLKQEISHAAIEAVKAIENTGVHFGNTGVDIAVEKNGKIRIIEIQHCTPSHDISYEAGFPDLYYQILKTNLLYAKKLAGFTST